MVVGTDPIVYLLFMGVKVQLTILCGSLMSIHVHMRSFGFKDDA